MSGDGAGVSGDGVSGEGLSGDGESEEGVSGGGLSEDGESSGGGVRGQGPECWIREGFKNISSVT